VRLSRSMGPLEEHRAVAGLLRVRQQRCGEDALRESSCGGRGVTFHIHVGDPVGSNRC